jgi:hypothetical protein
MHRTAGDGVYVSTPVLMASTTVPRRITTALLLSCKKKYQNIMRKRNKKNRIQTLEKKKAISRLHLACRGSEATAHAERPAKQLVFPTADLPYPAANPTAPSGFGGGGPGQVGRGPLVLLAMAMHERKTIDLEQGWEFMQKGITKLKNILEGMPEPQFSSEDYMMPYT